MTPSIRTLLLITSVSLSALPLSRAYAEGEPSVITKVGNAIEHGAEATANGIEKGAKAAARGIEKGANATVNGVERGAKATARGVERGAQATANAAGKAADKVTGSSSADNGN